MSTTAYAPAPPEILESVRTIVAREGERGATRVLCISRFSVSRVLGGLPVQRGTVALIRERLAELERATHGPARVTTQAAEAHV